jgi:hypothetical protein
LKAGDPQIIACQNVFAIDRVMTLNDFAMNEAMGVFLILTTCIIIRSLRNIRSCMRGIARKAAGGRCG